MLDSGVYDHLWPASFNTLALAHANRYPSPYSKHIISQDTLSRQYNAEDNTLITYKLIWKSGKLPRWAPRGIVAKAETYVVERSVLDVAQGVLTSETVNLDHRSVVLIKEKLRFEALDPKTLVSHLLPSQQS